jgi:hypothetical protein
MCEEVRTTRLQGLTTRCAAPSFLVALVGADKRQR